jgi:hypothetical protein
VLEEVAVATHCFQEAVCCQVAIIAEVVDLGDLLNDLAVRRLRRRLQLFSRRNRHIQVKHTNQSYLGLSDWQLLLLTVHLDALVQVLEQRLVERLDPGKCVEKDD